MIAKEKAAHLVNKFTLNPTCAASVAGGKIVEVCGSMSLESAKQCALICVDEIELYRRQIETEFDEDLYHAYGQEEYLQEVKKEIEKL
jgi:hypothetical protein